MMRVNLGNSVVIGNFTIRGLRQNLIPLIFLLFATTAPARSFLEPVFETLDEKAMRGMESTALEAGSHNPAAIRDLLMARYFLSERREIEGRIHAAADFRLQVQTLCQNLFPDGQAKSTEEGLQAGAEHFLGTSSAVCVLNQLAISSRRPAWQFFSVRPWIEALRLNSENDLEMVDHLYYDGRFYAENPAFFARRQGRALIAFQSILLLRLDVSSPLYWMARIHEKSGNWEAAEDNYDSALRRDPPDIRTQMVYGETERFRRLRTRNDRERFGWGAGVFYDPAKGLGGSVRVLDDSLFDTSRTLDASVDAGTRGVYHAQVHYSDDEIMTNRHLRSSVSAFRGVEDFYGFGTLSSASKQGQITATRTEGRVLIETDWEPGFSFGLGWMADSYKGEAATGSAPAQLSSSSFNSFFLSGPQGSLSYDSTDSDVLPTRGTRLSVEGLFPSQGFGSDVTFKRLITRFNQTFRIDVAHYLDLKVRLQGQDGNVPFGALTRLNSDFGPGLREGRLTDHWLGSVSVSYRQRIWGPVSAGAFGNIVDGGAQFSDLILRTPQLGGGIEALIQHGATRGDFIRIEAGYLADVTVIKFMAGQRL